MRTIFIGVIDYGMGNHASVVHTLRDLGFRVIITNDITELNLVDVLILPGVGAFPSAMNVLHKLGLVDYLKEQSRIGRPLVGICLGMQLFASASYEHTFTLGLELIPGNIVPFRNSGAHIGWNTVDLKKQGDSGLAINKDDTFYFNHSFYFKGTDDYQVASSQHFLPFASIIKRNNTIGLQFHPEKSQASGKALLRKLIIGLTHA